MSGRRYKTADAALRAYTKHAVWNALKLAEMGCYAFPVGLRNGHAADDGWKFEKVYFGDVKWKTDATTDPERILEMFAAHPGAAVGVATGPSRLVVIDRDDLTVDLGELAETFTYRSARGGEHRWYRAPVGFDVKSQNGFTGTDGKKRAGVDIKAWGGMTVYYGPKLTGGEF